MSFSKRFGEKPSEKEIQLESMDIDLRNSLWNVFDLHFLDASIKNQFDKMTTNSYFRELMNELWINHYKKTIDEIRDEYCDEVIAKFKKFL